RALPFGLGLRLARRVAAVEARQARAGQAQRALEARLAQVGEGRRADALPDLLDAERRRRELLPRRRVDAVVAGVADRRARDAEVDLGGAGPEQEPHEAARGRAAHRRVVDEDDALPRHGGRGGELEAHLLVAQVLGGVDEAPAGVGRAVEAVVVRNAAGARVPQGRGEAGLRHAHDDVGVDGRLAGQLLAHAHARL